MKEGLGRTVAAERAQIHLARPCRAAEKALYGLQLIVLIRSRIESGPLRTRSFLLPGPTRGRWRHGPAPGVRCRTGLSPPIQCKPEQASKSEFDAGHDRSNTW